MQYHSTRGGALPVDSARAVLRGLAEDGGLYLPERLPELDWRRVAESDTLSMAEAIASAFLPDIPDMPEGRTQREYEDELRTYAEQANNREGEN